MNMTFHTCPLEKWFLCLLYSYYLFFDVALLGLGRLFAGYRAGLCPDSILTFYQQVRSLRFFLLMFLAFPLFVASKDAFIGALLLSSFGLAPVLLVIGPHAWYQNLPMMKHYLKARFIWQFMGIVTACFALFLHDGVMLWIRFIILTVILLWPFICSYLWQASSHYINLHYSYLVYNLWSFSSVGSGPNLHSG